MIAMIALGVQKKGALFQPTVETNLVTGFTAAANIAFSYGPYSYSPAEL